MYFVAGFFVSLAILGGISLYANIQEGTVTEKNSNEQTRSQELAEESFNAFYKERDYDKSVSLEAERVRLAEEQGNIEEIAAARSRLATRSSRNNPQDFFVIALENYNNEAYPLFYRHEDLFHLAEYVSSHYGTSHLTQENLDTFYSDPGIVSLNGGLAENEYADENNIYRSLVPIYDTVMENISIEHPHAVHVAALGTKARAQAKILYNEGSTVSAEDLKLTLNLARNILPPVVYEGIQQRGYDDHIMAPVNNVMSAIGTLSSSGDLSLCSAVDELYDAGEQMGKVGAAANNFSAQIGLSAIAHNKVMSTAICSGYDMTEQQKAEARQTMGYLYAIQDEDLERRAGYARMVKNKDHAYNRASIYVANEVDPNFKKFLLDNYSFLTEADFN